MKVLIATKRSYLFGGLETFVRDLALGLERWGNAAVVWSDGFLGGMHPLEEDGLTICRDLDALPFQPDVIHGQSSVETMTAVTRLPTVPAIYHCHAVGPRSVPPLHPRVYRHAVVTTSLGQRLMMEFGIDESAIELVLNCVDLQRFTRVRVPPRRPVSALFYNSYHEPDGRTVQAIRAAAEASGLALDCIGRGFRNSVADPENVLPNYDIVFASGRSAIDALACGCAVIVISLTSCGEMVRSTSFERLRRANFSIAVNAPPPSVSSICAEIAKYDVDDCATVVRRLRQEADSALTIRQVETIYESAVTRHRAAVRHPHAEQQAAAGYLRRMAPHVRLLDEFRGGGSMPLTEAAASRSASSQLAAGSAAAADS